MYNNNYESSDRAIEWLQTAYENAKKVLPDIEQAYTPSKYKFVITINPQGGLVVKYKNGYKVDVDNGNPDEVVECVAKVAWNTMSECDEAYYWLKDEFLDACGVLQGLCDDMEEEDYQRVNFRLRNGNGNGYNDDLMLKFNKKKEFNVSKATSVDGVIMAKDVVVSLIEAGY